MTANNSGTSDGRRRLESIEVEITASRPRQTLKVNLTIGGMSFSGTFAGNDAMQFKTKLICQDPIIVDARVRRKVGFVKRRLGKDSFAQVPRTVATVDGNRAVVHDPKGSIKITLMFSSADGSSQREEEPASAAQEHQAVVDLPTSTPRPEVVSAAPDTSHEGASSASQHNITPGLDNARQILREKPAQLDKLGKFRTITEVLIRAGGAAAELNPIAKACFSAVEKIYQALEDEEMCRDAAIDLAERLEMYWQIIRETPELRKQPLSWRAVDTMLVLMKDISEYVIESLKKKGVDWKGEYRERMSSFGKQFDTAKEQFGASIATETFQMVQTGLTRLQISMLRDLEPVFKAYHNPEEGCLEGTRIELLAKLMQWIQSIKASGVTQEREVYLGMDLKRIVWLYGLAGSGKSTIANTVADMLVRRGFTVSCFFCKRDDPSRSSVGKVFPTLSYQLALLFPAYRGAITELLSGPDVGQVLKGVISSQVAELFAKPFNALPEPSMPHVIIIDALDECGDSPNSREKLVAGLITLAKATPWLKILITSRDQGEIRGGFGNIPELCHPINIRDVGDVDMDIRSYAKHELEKLKESRGLKNLSVADYTERLAMKAADLFVWISTVFRYLEKSKNAKARLDDLVLDADKREGAYEPFKELHKLYEKVLSASSDEDTIDVRVMRRILGIVNVSASTDPLPAKVIAAFLKTDSRFATEDVDSVGEHVRGLRAVLYEDKESGGAVRAYHPSFLDFLSTKMGLEGWESPSVINQLMFDASLSLLLSGLKFNICGLEDASVMNKGVTDLDERISRCIPLELDYSCQHWSAHLRGSELSAAEAQGTVSQLLCSVKVLFWLEVLSITGGAERCIPILQQCSAFFEGSEEILQASSDVLKLISSHSQAMASAPHIYISALAWVPTKSYLRAVLRRLFGHHLLVSEGLPANWDRSLWTKQFNDKVHAVAYSPEGRCVAACIGSDIHLLDASSGLAIGEPLKGHRHIVASISFSLDGTRIASGSYDNTLRIWDARTGQQIGEPLRGHSHDVNSVCFSPDGTLLASGSDDKTVRIWCSRTGQAIGEPLRGHSDWVLSVAFSPDGTRIASGSRNGTVRIWDSRTGEPVGEPLEGHTDWVRSIAFAPCGIRLISGSDDATIRIWDLRTGECIGEPLRGHSSWVYSVAFSLDGARIVSGSTDNTIRMWDSRTGAALRAPFVGHLASVNSVAFSRDGAHILSGSDDGTVRVWSLEESDAASEPQRGHTGAISSVAFSPDGTRIASGSDDKTVRIWNARTGQQVGEPLHGHSDWVRSVAFSPDGTRIVSGSQDETVRIWCSRTGETFGEHSRGHTSVVASVAFSHDGLRIVSGSWDKTVRIWDSRTGKPVGEPLRGHTDDVNSVAFAPDGVRVVSCSDDRSVRIWNLRTGECVGELLHGHSGAIYTVAFSPDGTLIASGSYDKTIRIWDAVTGESIGNPLEGHSGTVASIAFSPDGSRIVSGSWDDTVRIWDLKSGEAVGEPLRCHSSPVYSVAFFPDGSRIASGSRDESIFVTKLADPGQGTWNRMCRNMDVTDGWVKDDDGKLLLWIPERYRHFVKHNIAVWIRDGRLDSMAPVVNFAVLKDFFGTGWARIYEEGDEK